MPSLSVGLDLKHQKQHSSLPHLQVKKSLKMHTSTHSLCETQIILVTTCIYYLPVHVFELSMKQLMVFEAMAIISGF